MWARTKTHHIESENVTEMKSTRVKKKGWRDYFEEELKTHGEQGLYLQGLRLREGYTQAQLGQLIGVTQNNISAMENGRRSIGKGLALRLGQVFGVRYQRFL